jgi:hypothetical protein
MARTRKSAYKAAIEIAYQNVILIFEDIEEKNREHEMGRLTS